ncbi:MAG: Uma2 family endonuclease [Bacteroidota bacterium]
MSEQFDTSTELYQWTTTEFHQMVAAGILDEDSRVELINGQILHMSPVGRFHAACVSYLNDWLVQLLREAYIIRVQDPIYLDEYSEPEPDIAIVKRRPDFYAAGLPTPADIEILIEVADTSVKRDAEVKQSLYANASIKEYWMIDLNELALKIATNPQNGNYETIEDSTLTDSLTHSLIGEIQIRHFFPWLS